MQAERALRRAIELEPTSDNHWTYAYYLLVVGRFAESIEHFEEAKRRDPISTLLRWQEGRTYACAGRYDEAIAEFESLRRWGQPEGEVGRISMAYAYAHAGRYREAIAVLEDGIVRTDSAFQYVASLAYVEARAGDVGKARTLIAGSTRGPRAGNGNSPRR